VFMYSKKDDILLSLSFSLSLSLSLSLGGYSVYSRRSGVDRVQQGK